jgi:hypothetical protein
MKISSMFTIKISTSHLKVGEKEVKFALAGAFVEVETACLQHNTHKTQAKQMLWRVQV